MKTTWAGFFHWSSEDHLGFASGHLGFLLALTVASTSNSFRMSTHSCVHVHTYAYIFSCLVARVYLGSEILTHRGVQLGLETPNQQQLGLASPGKSRQVQASLGKSVGANNPILEWDTLGHCGTPAERRLQEIIKPCGRCIKP